MNPHRHPVQRAPLYNLAIGGSFSAVEHGSCCAAFELRSSNEPLDTPDYDSGEVRMPLGPDELRSAGALSIEVFRLRVDAYEKDYLTRGGAFALPGRDAPVALQEQARWGWLIPARGGKYTLCHSTLEPVPRWFIKPFCVLSGSNLLAQHIELRAALAAVREQREARNVIDTYADMLRAA